jgi:hypothetical protein
MAKSKSKNIVITVVKKLHDKQYERKVKQLKKEVSRKASMANKRLVRLKANKLTDVPAYRQFLNERGGKKFSVKGKSYNELRKELNEINRFLNHTTSTVRGARKVLKGIANTVGLKVTNVKSLPKDLSKFFDLANMIEQYLNVVENAGYSIGYKKIWEAINTYTQSSKIDLYNADNIMEALTEDIAQLIIAEQTNDAINKELSAFGWE